MEDVKIQTIAESMMAWAIENKLVEETAHGTYRLTQLGMAALVTLGPLASDDVWGIAGLKRTGTLGGSKD